MKPVVESIVLVGPRGAGKTTLAWQLATELGWRVADADNLLAARVGCPAGEYLARAGENAFREVEEAVVQAALDDNRGRVLALGGGAVLSGKTRARLQREEHFVVFLFAPASVLVERLGAGPFRPPLTDLPLAEEVDRVFQAREPLYKSVSDFELNTFSSNVAACQRSILDIMGRGG